MNIFSPRDSDRQSEVREFGKVCIFFSRACGTIASVCKLLYTHTHTHTHTHTQHTHKHTQTHTSFLFLSPSPPFLSLSSLHKLLYIYIYTLFYYISIIYIYIYIYIYTAKPLTSDTPEIWTLGFATNTYKCVQINPLK